METSRPRLLGDRLESGPVDVLGGQQRPLRRADRVLTTNSGGFVTCIYRGDRESVHTAQDDDVGRGLSGRMYGIGQ